MAEYIEREALYEKAYWHGEHPDVENPFPDGVDAVDIKDVDAIPVADVVSKEEYSHLLQIASKMHLWIFLHTGDEQKAYDEIGLTEKDNAILGYGGQFEIREE